MCGRVRLASDYSEIKIRLKFGSNSPAPNLEPSWNIPPTGRMLVATYAEGMDRVSELMHWGLIPGWSKDSKMKFPTLNARAETVDTLNTFRDAWKKGRRCLVVMDGFYEWRKSDKQPFAIGMANNGLMVMAGLWEEWKSPLGETIRSCTVITCPANGVIGALHDRMPVIIAEKDWPKWLGEEPATQEELKALLVPAPDDDLKVWKVDRRVGNVRNNDPELADPIPELL